MCLKRNKNVIGPGVSYRIRMNFLGFHLPDILTFIFCFCLRNLLHAIFLDHLILEGKKKEVLRLIIGFQFKNCLMTGKAIYLLCLERDSL